MRWAVTVDRQTFQTPIIMATPDQFEVALGEISQLAMTFTGGAPCQGAIIGLPGTLDERRASLLAAPHLKHWIGCEIKADLERELKLPVILENDAALVGLGEAVHGGGKGYGIVAYLTVSTGVGGVRIVDGIIDWNARGFEPGQEIMVIESVKTLEDLVSGAAIEKRFGRPPHDITDPALWEELARYLAIGVHNLIIHWSPQVVVIGGSMMKTPGINLSRVTTHLIELQTKFTLPAPPLHLATLGDIGGLYGGLVLLNQKFVS